MQTIRFRLPTRIEVAAPIEYEILPPWEALEQFYLDDVLIWIDIVRQHNLQALHREETTPQMMLVLLAVLVFVYNFAAGLYLAQGVEPLPTLEFLYTAAFLCGVVWWLNAEAGRSAVKPVYCLGLLVGIGWLIIIPYHLLKTRGAKGVIPLMALAGSFVIAHISALIVYQVFL